MESTSSDHYQKMLKMYYDNSDISTWGPSQHVMPTIDNVPIWINSQINNPDGSNYIDVDFWKNEIVTSDFKDKLTAEIKAWNADFYRKASEERDRIEQKKQDDFVRAFENEDWFKRVYNGNYDLGLVYPYGNQLEIPVTVVSLNETNSDEQSVIVKMNGVVEKKYLAELNAVIVPTGTGISTSDVRSAILKNGHLKDSIDNWYNIVNNRNQLAYVLKALMKVYPNKNYGTLNKGDAKRVVKDLMNEYLNANYGILNKSGDGYLLDRFPTSGVFMEWIVSKNKAEPVKPKLSLFDKLFSRKPRMSETKFGGKSKKNKTTKKKIRNSRRMKTKKFRK